MYKGFGGSQTSDSKHLVTWCVPYKPRDYSNSYSTYFFLVVFHSNDIGRPQIELTCGVLDVEHCFGALSVGYVDQNLR